MKVEKIEIYIEKNLDSNYVSIIELIVDAVKAFPQYELNETENYFKEVKKILKSNEITLQILKKYLANDIEHNSNETAWIIDSMSSLVEAFELMKLYKISFDEIRGKIESLT